MQCTSQHQTHPIVSPPPELPTCNLNSAFLIDTNDFMTIQKNDDDDLQKALRTLTRQRLLTQSRVGLSWAGQGQGWVWGLSGRSVIELAVQTFDKLMNCNAQVATVQRTASTDEAEIDNVTKEGTEAGALTVVATPTQRLLKQWWPVVAQLISSSVTSVFLFFSPSLCVFCLLKFSIKRNETVITWLGQGKCFLLMTIAARILFLVYREELIKIYVNFVQSCNLRLHS